MDAWAIQDFSSLYTVLYCTTVYTVSTLHTADQKLHYGLAGQQARAHGCCGSEGGGVVAQLVGSVLAQKVWWCGGSVGGVVGVQLVGGVVVQLVEVWWLICQKCDG